MITDKHFIDWESYVFGYGYGTGEPHIFEALKKFFQSMHESPRGNLGYGYEAIEKEMGSMAAWLLLNTLLHADILSYGTSPRFGFLNPSGTALAEYLRDKTVDQLCEIVDVDEHHVYCFPKMCQCEKPCENPLFQK